jgi:molybdopterin converting factor small subunit
MNIFVKFSSHYKDILGIEEIQIELKENSTLKDAISNLKEQIPQLFPEIEFAMFFVNNQFVAYPETILKDRSIIQVLPPISGG